MLIYFTQFTGHLRLKVNFNKPMPYNLQLLILAEFTGTMTLLKKGGQPNLSYRAI